MVMFDGTIAASFSGKEMTQENIVSASIGEIRNAS
jgi:hypothetical protein